MVPSLLSVITGVAVVAAAAAVAPAQTRKSAPDTLTPFLLISPFTSPDQSLAWRLADTLRALVEARIPKRDLYVIPRRAVEQTLVFETPTGPWPIDDVRELGRMLRASFVLDVGVHRTASGLELTPILLRGRGEPATLPTIAAPTLGRAAAALAHLIVTDSSLRRPRVRQPQDTLSRAGRPQLYQQRRHAAHLAHAS